MFPCSCLKVPLRNLVTNESSALEATCLLDYLNKEVKLPVYKAGSFTWSFVMQVLVELGVRKAELSKWSLPYLTKSITPTP